MNRVRCTRRVKENPLEGANHLDGVFGRSVLDDSHGVGELNDREDREHEGQDEAQGRSEEIP